MGQQPPTGGLSSTAGVEWCVRFHFPSSFHANEADAFAGPGNDGSSLLRTPPANTVKAERYWRLTCQVWEDGNALIGTLMGASNFVDGTTYYEGRLIPLEDAVSRLGGDGPLEDESWPRIQSVLDEAKQKGDTHVVLARDGKVYPFSEQRGDSIFSPIPPG